MDIGREGKRFRTEPLKDPFEKEPPVEPVEQPETPATVPEKEGEPAR